MFQPCSCLAMLQKSAGRNTTTNTSRRRNQNIGCRVSRLRRMMANSCLASRLLRKCRIAVWVCCVVAGQLPPHSSGGLVNWSQSLLVPEKCYLGELLLPISRPWGPWNDAMTLGSTIQEILGSRVGFVAISVGFWDPG